MQKKKRNGKVELLSHYWSQTILLFTYQYMGNESMGIGQSERPAITEETMKLQEYQKHLDGHLQSGAKMLMERLELQ